MQGYNVLLEPYEPIPGFRAVIIEDSGHPIELVQTELTDEELGSARNLITFFIRNDSVTPSREFFRLFSRRWTHRRALLPRSAFLDTYPAFVAAN